MGWKRLFMRTLLIFRLESKTDIIHIKGRTWVNREDFYGCSMESLEGMEYRKVKLRGTFDYTNEVLMGPRQLYNYAVDVKPTGGSFMGPSTSPSGFHVITPFQLEGHK